MGFFEHNNTRWKIGRIAGFIFSYLLFTTILFFILQFTGRISGWTYFHVMAATLIITAFGAGLKRLLK